MTKAEKIKLLKEERLEWDLLKAYEKTKDESERDLVWYERYLQSWATLHCLCVDLLGFDEMDSITRELEVTA